MMELIKDTFDSHFAHWEITLSEEDVVNRHSGYIQKAGWLIQYCFGKDEQGAYLDYYAAHRMTNDRHVRIYESGQAVDLPALLSMRLVSEDPVEDKRLEDEYSRHNQQVAKMLVEKGFDKFTVNMYLHAGLEKETKK